MVLLVPHYLLPDQLVRPPHWIFRCAFPSHLNFYWVIKILPNILIQNNNSVCWLLYLPPTIPHFIPFHKIQNILRIVIFCLLGKCSNSFLSLNIVKGIIIWFCTLTKPNMHQLIQINGKQITYIWKKSASTPSYFLSLWNINHQKSSL